MKIDELLRLACIYAENDRLEYLRAISTSDYEEEKKETRDFIKQLRAYRMKRWGKSKMESALETCVEIAVSKIPDLILGVDENG